MQVPRKPAAAAPVEATRLSELTAQQWRSGIAAWLGWLFDGFDMHIYTLVALPFVALLIGSQPTSSDTGWYASWIQAAFLVGWALGGAFFGRVGDRLGRSRALMLTILTYAIFTGASFFATAWWHLLIFRFLAALGIGGEWAVGAALISETWPKSWRPWLAGILQSAVNIGVLLAMLAGGMMVDLPPNYVFLIGILPALLVVWIRRAVPEPAEWHAAKLEAGSMQPRVGDLFRGNVRRTTLLTLGVCGLSLTAHWAFMFWSVQHLRNLPETVAFTDGQRTAMVANALILLMCTAIVGNLTASAIARALGYRLTIVLGFVFYFSAMFFTYYVPRDYQTMFWWLAVIGLCQGTFGLFTMYMPPLFPTLLRTTGAGFCYNFGRIAAAAGTVFFGAFGRLGDYRMALLYASFLFVPAAVLAMFLGEPADERKSDA
jgi:MFS family permease